MDYCLVQSSGQTPNKFTVHMPEILNRDKLKYEIGVKSSSMFPAITNISGEPVTITMKHEPGRTTTNSIRNVEGLNFDNALAKGKQVTGGLLEPVWSIKNKSDKPLQLMVSKGVLENDVDDSTIIPTGETWLGDLRSLNVITFPASVAIKELNEELIKTAEDFNVMLQKNANAARDIPNLVELKHTGAHFKSAYVMTPELAGAEVNWTVTNISNKKLRFWFGEGTRQRLINGVNEVCFDLNPGESKTLTILNKVAIGALPKMFEMKVQEVSLVKNQVQVKVGPRYYADIDGLLKTLNAKIAKKAGGVDVVIFKLRGEEVKMLLGERAISVDLGDDLHKVLGFLERVYPKSAKSSLPPDLSKGLETIYIQCNLVKMMRVNDQDKDLLAIVDLKHSKPGQVTKDFATPIYRPMKYNTKASFELYDETGAPAPLIGNTKLLLHFRECQ